MNLLKIVKFCQNCDVCGVCNVEGYLWVHGGYLAVGSERLSVDFGRLSRWIIEMGKSGGLVGEVGGYVRCVGRSGVSGR